IRDKIKRAVTDESGGKNLLSLLDQFSDAKKLVEKFQDEFKTGSIKYSELKPVLAESIIEKLKPIRDKRKIYEEDLKLVEKILIEGTNRARQVSSETLKKVKEKMFLDYF
ncbi:MAG: Tryptophanyl-tRNA synthetase, partial [uncultured bacterium]